jgi:hypothetical protein
MFIPAMTMPVDTVLVVRSAALREFETRLAGHPQNPLDELLDKRQEKSYLQIISALSEMNKLDLSHASKAAAAIARQTEILGHPVNARTIENHLKADKQLRKNES